MRPPTEEAVILGHCSLRWPPAATPEFGDTFQLRALQQVCTERLLHIGHSFIFNLPLEARKCVLGLDRGVSDQDI